MPLPEPPEDKADKDFLAVERDIVDHCKDIVRTSAT